MSTGIDALIDAVVVSAQIETGTSVKRALTRARSVAGKRVAMAARSQKPYNERWSPDEDEFLRKNIGRLSEEEIAVQLGRSVLGVHLRWDRDLKICPPTKAPDEVTAEQIAEGLGIDSKTVHHLIDRGILPGRRAPTRNVCRLVNRKILLHWLTNPNNWIYFDPKRVAVNGPRRTKTKYDHEFWQHAQCLVNRARARWQDAWLTTGQVAAYYHVDHRLVNHMIHSGKIKAIKWGNWRILKSESIRKERKFFAGSTETTSLTLTDAHLILGKAIGAYVSWQDSSTAKRLRELRRQHRIRGVITQFGLHIDYGRSWLFADWKKYRRQFPTVAQAMDKFRHGEALTPQDIQCVHAVLTVWLSRFYFKPDRGPFAQWLCNKRYYSILATHLHEAYQRLRDAGIDPYRPAKRRVRTTKTHCEKAS